MRYLKSENKKYRKDTKQNEYFKALFPVRPNISYQFQPIFNVGHVFRSLFNIKTNYYSVFE
jgi:hypothetical protein